MKMYVQDKSTSERALTLVEVLIVIFIVVILFGLMIPASTGRRDKAIRIKCVSNLKQVGLGFRVWEGDKNDNYPMRTLTNNVGEPLYTGSSNAFKYFQIMSNELSNPQILICPDDRKRRAATNWTTDFNASHISFFLGLDADESFPQLFLTGDAHLTNGQPLKNGIMELTPAHPGGWTEERHNGAGNIAMADGSVQQLNSESLRLIKGMTNRLLMPP